MKSRLQCGRDMCQALYLPQGDLKGRRWNYFRETVFPAARGEHAHHAHAKSGYKGLGRKQTYV